MKVYPQSIKREDWSCILGPLDGIKEVKGESNRVQASLFLCLAENVSGPIAQTGFPDGIEWGKAGL